MKDNLSVYVSGLNASKLDIDKIKSNEEYEGFVYALDSINQGNILVSDIINLIEDYYITTVDFYELDTKRKKAYFLCSNGATIKIPITDVHLFTE